MGFEKNPSRKDQFWEKKHSLYISKLNHEPLREGIAGLAILLIIVLLVARVGWIIIRCGISKVQLESFDKGCNRQ